MPVDGIPLGKNGDARKDIKEKNEIPTCAHECAAKKANLRELLNYLYAQWGEEKKQ
jgi:hypothetical protein